MSSIRCSNGHTHPSVDAVKVCYGMMVTLPPVTSAPVTVTTRPATAPAHPSRYPSPSGTVTARSGATGDRATARQYAYIESLGGDTRAVLAMTKDEASAYIDRLKKGDHTVTAPTPAPQPVRRQTWTDDKRFTMIDGLMDSVPIGYFAVRNDVTEAFRFIRIARPKPDSKNQFAGSTKIQTQHGPRLETRLVRWPSGKWSNFGGFNTDRMLGDLMLILANGKEAQLAYGLELKHCMRCNCELTDERSRFYGIGPECETKHGYGWVIDTVDAMRDGSYEYHYSRGTLPDAVELPIKL